MMRSASNRSRTAKEARQQCRASVVRRDAVIVGDYRYVLERELAEGNGTLCVVMINPSKADSLRDDHTITKLIEFTRRLGFKRLLVGNLCAYRATDVSALLRVRDAVGEYNDVYLRQLIIQSDKLVFAWGNKKKLPQHLQPRVMELAATAAALRKQPYCWGTTKSGCPSHPLRLPYKSKLKRWIA